MPYTKSAQTLQHLCIITVAKYFIMLQEDVKRLPSVMIDHLYQEMKDHKLNISRYPSKLFLNQSTTKLDNLNNFDLRKDNIIFKTSLICQNLRELNLEGCKDITSFSLKKLIKNIRNIEKLNLNITLCSDSVLATIGKYSHQLRYLHINNCKLITDLGIDSLCSVKMKIIYLDISNCTKITATGCILALDYLEYLREFQCTLSHDVLKLLKYERNLKFCAGSLKVYTGIWFRTLEEMETATVVFPNLSHVRVNAVNDDLTNLILKFKQLENLSVFLADYDNKLLMNCILPKINYLTSLSIYGGLEINLQLIGYSCPYLKTLALVGVTSFSDSLTSKMYYQIPFKYIRNIQLNGIRSAIPEKHLEMLFTNPCRLELIELIQCDVVTDGFVNSIICWGNLNYVQKIVVKTCHKITVFPLLKLLQFDNPLSVFCVSKCKRIRKKAYEMLINYVLSWNLDVQMRY